MMGLKNSGTDEPGFIWKSVDDGYVWEIGSHKVTDELIAEGKRRFMQDGSSGKWTRPHEPLPPERYRHSNDENFGNQKRKRL